MKNKNRKPTTPKRRTSPVALDLNALAADFSSALTTYVLRQRQCIELVDYAQAHGLHPFKELLKVLLMGSWLESVSEIEATQQNKDALMLLPLPPTQGSSASTELH